MAELENKVQDLQELVTVNHVFRNVIYRQEKRFLSDKRILFSVNFEIKAGIPMEEAKVHMNLEGIPEITLPKARILSVDADETSIKEIFIKELWAEIRQSDYMEVLVQEKERLTLEAQERGILNDAEFQAKQLISRLFYLAGFDEVIYNIKGDS